MDDSLFKFSPTQPTHPREITSAQLGLGALNPIQGYFVSLSLPVPGPQPLSKAPYLPVKGTIVNGWVRGFDLIYHVVLLTKVGRKVKFGSASMSAKDDVAFSQ